MSLRRFKIAAVIPVYNGAAFIRRSLESVLNQTRAPEEIIIVDDGSTDDGASLVAAVANGDPRVRLLGQENAGQSAARNHAVKNSGADLIAFLDQDDWWYPAHLELLETPFLGEQSRPLGWSYSDLDEYDVSGKMVTHQMLSQFEAKHPKRSLVECLGGDMMVLPSASLISRAAFDSVGGFDPRLSGYEDDDLFLRIFRAGYDNVFIPNSLSAWCIHTGSASYSSRMARSGLIFAQKLLDEFPDEEVRGRFLERDVIGPRFIKLALAHYVRVVSSGKRNELTGALAGIDLVRKRLRGKYRTALAALRPFMGSYLFASIGLKLCLHRVFQSLLR